jgi:pantoate--beta-alanine ligase
MEIIEKVKDMQAYSQDLRVEGKVITFVPTMGYLHEGHLSLMKEGRKRGDVLVVSVFVNPTQFGPGEDFKQYPRDFESDNKMMESVGVDVVFYPGAEEVYPEGYQTYVTVEDVTKNLCGMSRPHHFRGVATVCAKLFNCVLPHIAIFGRKDYQQLKVIEKMVKDMNMDVGIIGMPIVREPDGLAMSSRNEYLDKKERKAALCLYNAILAVREQFENGERRVGALTDRAVGVIMDEELATIDYVKLAHPEAITDLVGVVWDRALLALAVRIGKTRLIDNTVLGEEFEKC